MTTSDRSNSTYLAPAVLVLSTLLVAANWYLRPERAGAWAITALFLGAMTAALVFASRHTDRESARGRAGELIRSAVILAGLSMVVALGAKLASFLGVLQGAELSQRTSMVVLGLIIVFAGNAVPKMLTPISSLRCDPARAQALRRITGWTWVLSGLAYAIAWMVLPVAQAEPVSMLLLMGGVLINAAVLLRPWRI
jgi:hypothetical protein